MSSFDSMAVATDWFDAYRAASLSIVDLYAKGASLECGCRGQLLVTGRDAITEYWRLRFAEQPAGKLRDLRPDDRGVALSYCVPDGVVQAILTFDETGMIWRSRCGSPLEAVVSPQITASPVRHIKPLPDRDRYYWDLECPRCKRTGVADVSENASRDLCFAVDGVSEGFRVSRPGANAVDTEIICISCNIPV